MTFEEAIEKFSEYLEFIQKSNKTICNYTAQLKDFNKYLCKTYNRPVYLEEVKADDMEKYLFNELSEAKYSSSYRHGMVTAFRSLYNFCFAKGHSDINIGKMVKFIKVYTKERTYISELELMRITKQIKSTTVKAVLWTIFYTGIRISEAINLKITDINFEHEYVFVKAGKGNKERQIPMNEKLRNLLIEYFNENRVDMSTDNFFSCKTGGISVVRVQEVLRETLQDMGIDKHITPHVLRHSFASNLIERGVDIFKVQKLLGHESIKTTGIYLHTNMDELERVVNML
jgi:integrase/recombinase XerD